MFCSSGSCFKSFSNRYSTEGVVSTHCRTILVERRFTHPVLKKTIRKSKKYRAHDENNTFKVGDTVRIIECAPKSKTKRWEVLTSDKTEA